MPQTSRLIIGIQRRIGVISLLGFLAAGSAAGAQPRELARPRQTAPPVETGTASISGHLVDARTRKPAAGVEVSLTTLAGGEVRESRVTTDAGGTYAFVHVAEGLYMLTTYSVDYEMACYSNTATERCSRIELVTDQLRANIDLALTPNAIARGRVVDEDGAPIANAMVGLSREFQPSAGVSAPSQIMSGRPMQTSENGTFELRGIAPGTWVLETWSGGAKNSMILPPVFYPNVFQREDSTPIEFTAGEVRDDLVITVPSTTRNSLTVHIASGAVAIGDVRAMLIRATPPVTKGIALSDDGAGTVTGLLPGKYFVSARGWINDRAWAAFEVADFFPPSLDLSLQMKPAGSIRGRIVAQNGGLPPLDGVVVAAGWSHDGVEISPATPDQVPATADGSFTIDGVFGQRTMRLIALSPEWRIYAIRQGQSNVAHVDVPFERTVDITIVVARK